MASIYIWIDIPDDSLLLQKDEFEGIEEGKNIIYKWIDKDKIKKSNIKPNCLKKELTNIKTEMQFIEESDM